MTLITPEKRDLFHSYALDFEKKYLLEPDGQRHQSIYKKEREKVKHYWTEIKKAKREGKHCIVSIMQWHLMRDFSLFVLYIIEINL